jgi:hypothetical protein
MEQNTANGHHDYKKLSSITPSGFFGDGPENIVTCENFLTEEERDKLTKFAFNNTVWDYTEDHFNENGTVIYEANYWKDRVATHDSLMKADPEILDLVNKMIDRLQPVVEAHFKVKVQPTGPAIVRWPVGTRQDPHADKELHEGPDAGKPNDFPHYDIGSIFYFNEDYEGGELFFPNQGIEFKPKAGNAYFFPGDKNYIHGVRPITGGNRFTSPFFWTILEHVGDK